MISEMTVVIPRKERDRSWIPREERESFAKITGIAHTWEWEGSTLSLAAIAAAGMMEKDVRSLVVVTQSPDGSCPPTAIRLGGEIGLRPDIPMFDVNHACAGFVYGLWLANRLPKPCMLVLVDRLRMDQYQPPTSSLIFSDAAAAMVITADTFSTLGEPTFFNDHSGADKLQASRAGFMSMNGGAVFDFVTRNVPKLISQHQEAHGYCDLLVQHQANISIMNWIERKCGYDGKSLHCIQRYGNMSMVSIPAAIAANEDKVLEKRLMLVGYGAGWSAGLMNIEWGPRPVCTVVRC